MCAEDAFVHHFGEASFGELVPTGRYGELFRANKARFEEKWGVTWQPHLRRPNAWYRDLVERIRAVVDRRACRRTRPCWSSRTATTSCLQLGAERRGWHFPQMEDGTYAGYHPGDSAEAIAHFEALEGAGCRVHGVPGDRSWWLTHYAELVKRFGSPSVEPDSDCESCVVLSLSL